MVQYGEYMGSLGRSRPVLLGMASLAALVAGLNGGAAQAQACFVPSTNGPAGSQICDLSDSTTQQSSLATAVNADGTVVVGELRIGGIEASALWRNGVLEPFAAPVGTTRGRANDVSADGSVVIGTIDTANSFRAYSSRRLPTGGDEIVLLDVLSRGTRSEGLGVNAAGNIVVGHSFSRTDGTRAVRWVDGVIQDLGVIGNPDLFPTSSAKDVNAAGNVVVGDNFDGSFLEPFRWVEGVGMQRLGALPGGSFSGAEAVNAAGNVVVGFSDSDLGQRAFRWVEGVGLESLGVLPGGAGSIAYDVNADGTVVVGQSDSDDGGRAFRWVAGGTMVSLGTLTGASSSAAYGVNADGSIVVGESDQRAFIWRATPSSGGGGAGGTGGAGGGGGGTIEDLANLTTSFPVLGNDSAVVQAEQQFALERLMGPGSTLAVGQSAMTTSAALQSTDRNPTTVGARTTSVAALGFSHGISATVTLGATLSLSGTSLKNNAFDMDAGPGLAVWGQYSAGGTDRTGLQVSGALGFARSEGEVARGRLLTDVITATGQADVETRALHATVGYGLTGGNWLVTPALGLARYDTERSAYTETGAAFNASYDALETRRTVATLSVTGEMALGERGRLSLGVGVDREVNPEQPRLTGRSDLPGLATFDIGSTFAPNRTRAFATVGYAHDLGDGATLSADLRVGEAVFGTTPSVGLGVTYGIRF